MHFMQDNHSCSAQSVLRGLYCQLQHPQGKLVRVLRGAVFDATVYERCISWSGPAIGITWLKGLPPQLSAKDQVDLGLVQSEVFS